MDPEDFLRLKNKVRIKSLSERAVLFNLLQIQSSRGDHEAVQGPDFINFYGCFSLGFDFF